MIPDGTVVANDIGIVVNHFGTVVWPPFNSISTPIGRVSSSIDMQLWVQAINPFGGTAPSLDLSIKDVTDPQNPISVDFNADLGGTFTVSGGIENSIINGQIFWPQPAVVGHTYEFTFTSTAGSLVTKSILYIKIT